MQLTLRVLGRRKWWARACAREGAQEADRPADVTISFLLLLKVYSGQRPPSGLAWKQLHPSECHCLCFPNESLPATEQRVDKEMYIISA